MSAALDAHPASDSAVSTATELRTANLPQAPANLPQARREDHPTTGTWWQDGKHTLGLNSERRLAIQIRFKIGR